MRVPSKRIGRLGAYVLHVLEQIRPHSLPKTRRNINTDLLERVECALLVALRCLLEESKPTVRIRRKDRFRLLCQQFTLKHSLRGESLYFLSNLAVVHRWCFWKNLPRYLESGAN